jgi:endonuclease III
MDKQKRINLIMKNLAKYYDYKERTTLNSMRKKPNAYKILIACLLSLRARDEYTEKVSKQLFAVADTPPKNGKAFYSKT